MTGLGLAVSVLCIWLSFRSTSFSELGDALQHINYWLLIPLVAGNVLSLMVRGYRWRVLLADRGAVREYVWAQAVGCLLTNIFPLRAGEAGRVVLLSRRIGIPLVQVGASVVLERAADLLAVLGMLAVMLLVMDVPWAIMATGLILAAATAAACLGIAAVLLFERPLSRVVGAIGGRLPPRAGRLVLDIWVNALAGIAPLANRRILGLLVFWTLLMWVGSIGVFWAAIEAVVPGARLVESTFALTATALGVSLPSSPGFIGVYQYVGQLALVTPFPDRYTPATALTIALLGHAVYYVTTTVLGLFGLARLGLSPRAMWASASQPPAAQPSAAG